MDLRIYKVILQTVAEIRPEMELIARRDSDLENQMRRAATSMALNCSEASYSRGRNVQVRFHTALGSAREMLACIEVGVALGYVPAVRGDVRERMNEIIGTLTRLAR